MVLSEFRTLVLKLAMQKGVHAVETLERTKLNSSISDELATFSELTRCIFRDQVPLALHPNVHTYDLRGNRLAAEVFEVRSVTIGGVPLTNFDGIVGQVPLEHLRQQITNYASLPAGEPSYWSYIAPHSFRLTPAPSAAFIATIQPTLTQVVGGYAESPFGGVDGEACKMCGLSELRLLFTSDPSWHCAGRGMIRTAGGSSLEAGGTGIISTTDSSTFRTPATFGDAATGTSWTGTANVFDGEDDTWAAIGAGLTTWLKVEYPAFSALPGDATITGVMLDRVILRHRGEVDPGTYARMTFGLSLDGGSTVPGTLFTVPCGDQAFGQDMGPIGGDGQLWGNTAAALKTAALAGNLFWQCRRSRLLDEDQSSTREIAGARLTLFYTAASVGTGHYTLRTYVENSPPTSGTPNPPSVDRELWNTFVSGFILHPRLLTDDCPLVVPREYQRSAAAYVASRLMLPNADLDGVLDMMKTLDGECESMMRRLMLAEQRMAIPLGARGSRLSTRRRIGS